jgi:hypothetical protein
MTDDAKNADELAALKKKVEELEAKVSPPKSDFVPMSDAEWRDQMHQMRERQANSWMPPSAIREMIAAEPKGFMHDVALRDAHAPQGPGTSIPSSQSVSNVRTGGTGWVDPRPLDVPGGARAQELIERGVNAALPHGPEWGKEKKE